MRRICSAACAAFALFLGLATVSNAQLVGEQTINNSSITNLHLGGGIGPEATLVYDSTANATAGLVFTTNNPNASFGDDFTPTAAFNPIKVTGVNFGFVVPANTAVPNCDAIVTFYDVENGAATATTPALTSPINPSVRINVGSFASNTAIQGFQSGMVDVSALGLQIPNNANGISIAFVAANTNTILTGTTITPGLSAGAVAPGSNFLTYFYLDGFGGAPLDGNYTGAERVGFGGANTNNNKLWLQIQGDPVPEPATIGLAGLAVVGLISRRRRA